MSSSRCCKAMCAASCWEPDSTPVAPGPHEAAGPEAEAATTGDSSVGILRPWAGAAPRGGQNSQTLSGGAEVCRRSRGRLTGGQDLSSERPRKAEGPSLQPWWAVQAVRVRCEMPSHTRSALESLPLPYPTADATAGPPNRPAVPRAQSAKS